MAIKVTFLPSGITAEANPGDNLTDIATNAGVDIPTPCGGQGACGSCRVIIKKGHFGKVSDEEEMWGLPENERLGCKCVFVEGVDEVEVEVL